MKVIRAYIFVYCRTTYKNFRTHLLFQIFSLFTLWNKRKKFADSQKNFVKFQNFQKFNENQILLEANFWNTDHSWTFPGPCEVPQQIWARLVQLFWRFLDTNRQTNKRRPRQANYIWIDKLKSNLVCRKENRERGWNPLCL